MVNQSRTSKFLTQEWLESGWILERLPSSENPDLGQNETPCFLIGGGDREHLDPQLIDGSNWAVWAPQFFPSSVDAFKSTWSYEISRTDLLQWLADNFPGPPSSSKIQWRTPSKNNFEIAFKRIQTAIREDGVKKAVPVIFASGSTATADRRAWLANRLRAGLVATASNKLRLYGSWSQNSGFIGATPEALFLRRGSEVSSMAVAGTRSVRGVSEFAAILHDLETDPKERREHELVAQDIAAVFESVTGTKTSTRSQVRAESFGALAHLVTDFSVKINGGPSTVDWVKALHPTPALGTSPRDSRFKLLREIHELSAEGTERENFGAPFVVKYHEELHALVAIRQVRWRTDEAEASDVLHVAVGSGCGVVAESDVDREWRELQAKRDAVASMFRLSPEISRPVFWSLDLLQELLHFGVRKFVVCAGARNAPLVVALEALRQAAELNSENAKIRVESFFDERAGAFYALGLSRSSREPVAIVTTSGTAVSELLPAMTEADYSGVPLIALTADRPRRLRLSGAPQTIPQDQIFKDFSERTWDLEEGDPFDLDGELSGRRPLHINVCLEEPLIKDAVAAPEQLAERARVLHGGVLLTTRRPTSATDHALAFSGLAQKLNEPSLVAIVGALHGDEQDAVASFLAANAIPCLLEGPSGLRGDLRLQNLELQSGDRYLQKNCVSGRVQHLLRLGGVPTTRVWRDLDDVNVKTQTLSVSRLRFSGLSRGQFIHLPGLNEFTDFLKRATPTEAARPVDLRTALILEDREAARTLEHLLSHRSHSEPGFVRQLSELIPTGAQVYVGNSLPIRWWDLAATRKLAVTVEANRGVNGIDGQLSTAFGLAAGVTDTSREMWILVGDLTALYDLSAPWALANGALANMKTKIRIIVLNNSGGRIFKRMLAGAPGGSAPFENEHGIGFKCWAEMWNLGYARVMTRPELLSAVDDLTQDHAVIEIAPSAIETEKFWAELP